MDTNGNKEDGNKAKEEKSMYENGESTCLEVGKFYCSVISWELEQKPGAQ